MEYWVGPEPITPPLHYSITPIFRDSITPILHFFAFGPNGSG